MKKLGFTLAEVLITLGIVGVIAAITLPTLMTDTTSAQIGPKLAKAVSMFEQANEALLNANSVDSLTDFGLEVAGGYYPDSEYSNELAKFFKFSDLGSGKYLSKDGMIYNFTEMNLLFDNATDPAHKQYIGRLAIDINGDSKPNADGTDIFYFTWWNDGSLRPMGGIGWNGLSSSNKGGASHWEKQCPRAEDGTPTTSGYMYCAGHVFENNLKVLYR